MRAVVGFIAVLLGVRTGLVGYAWLQSNEAIGEFRQVTRSIQPGDKVLVVWHRGGAGGGDRSYRHLIYNFQPYDSFAPLLTVDRRAFWPTLFTSRTLQPVHVRHRAGRLPSNRRRVLPTPRSPFQLSVISG
jgi:hypothetical protein